MFYILKCLKHCTLTLELHLRAHAGFSVLPLCGRKREFGARVKTDIFLPRTLCNEL